MKVNEEKRMTHFKQIKKCRSQGYLAFQSEVSINFPGKRFEKLNLEAHT